MILPEDADKEAIERAWQEEDRLRQQQISPRPESIISYHSTTTPHRNGGLPLPPPPYYNPNPFHATVGAFSTEDVADSANVGFARRRNRTVSRPSSATGSFSSSLDEAEGQSRDPFSDAHLQPRPRSRGGSRGVYDGGNDMMMVQVGGALHQDGMRPSLSSTGFSTGAVLSSDEHPVFFDRRGSNREDATLSPSTETRLPNGARGARKGKQRNRAWIAEPDIDVHKTVIAWNGTVSDLGRWLSDHAVASTVSLKRRKWKRWNKKRWAVFWIIVILLVGSLVGGIFGGLDIANNSKPPKIRMPGPDGSRVIVPWESSASLAFDPMKDGAPAEDGVSSHCNAFVELPGNDILRGVSFSPSGLNQSIVSYSLNQNATSIFIHTQGDASTGMIQIVGSDDKRLMDAGAVLPGKIRVDVIMRTTYNGTKALVCKMDKADGGQGVGVYNLETIREFAVVTDQMSVRFGEMTNIATFKNVTVDLGRGLISASYLAAEDISLKTRTSSIMGTFNVSRSLNLNTTSGGLSSRVILHNPLLKADPYVNDTATYLPSTGDQSHLDLFRRDIKAAIHRRHEFHPPPEEGGWSTTSPNPSAETGSTATVYSSDALSRFLDPDTAPLTQIKVRAMTTNGPLSIRYLYQAPGVVLDSSVQTRNGEARTQMHPAFQGSFLVRSVNGDLRMEQNYNGTVDMDDPWNLSRTKLVLFSQGSNGEIGGWNDTNLELDDDAKSVYGSMRGGMAYNTAEGSWDVSGSTLWLNPLELSKSDNITDTVLELASACPSNITSIVDSSCSGASAVRRSRSVTQTSWGGAELSFET
ncbi:hypothetical protein QFC21_003457 [Naganishia friedmannii]|uniref:Uncharacterized protein n=1 Tax=Naganishia friedmannii TaxID=89922 RepID=A0ACC2VQ48_9TREE|nr:hypothetical protein QFC21_003457 [Naganishia friedmannii]